MSSTELCRLEDLLGIVTPISFIKVTSPSSRHTSDHEPIASVTPFSLPCEGKPGAIAAAIEPILVQSEKKERSSFLYKVVRLSKGRVNYGSEADIQGLVKTFLENILGLMGVDSDVEIVQNVSIKKKSADIYLVRSMRGVPILVCEVKSPIEVNGEDVLQHPCVVGQMFDYMTELRHMFGQREVFGILTNLKNWKICCFPDTVDHATTTDFSSDRVSLRVPFPTARAVCASRLISLNDAQLGYWLVLYLKKAMNATFKPLSLLSDRRGFLQYTKEGYVWKTLPKLSAVRISLPAPQTEGFNILRYFHGGADGNVALAITDSGHLAVLKVHHDDNRDREEAEDVAHKEIELWQRLYGVKCFQVTLKTSMTAMVMPLVFHARTDPEDREVHPWINFNLKEWSKAEGVVAAAEPCPLLDSWTEKLIAAWRRLNMSVEEIAAAAISRVARAGYKHCDVKWSHVAVLPALNAEDNDVVELQPVLFDLAIVEECAEGQEQEAIAAMRRQLLANN